MGKVAEVPLAQLQLWREGNVRKSDALIDIDDLARNIRQNGLMVPLVVVEDVPGKRYLVISGQRRLEAIRRIGYDPVEVVIVKDADLRRARVLSLSENLYRRQMNEDDISDAVDYLFKEFGTIAEVASHLGVSEPTVTKYLGYKNVPEQIKELVRDKKITSTQAIQVNTKFSTNEKRVTFAEELAKIAQPRKKSKFYQAIKEAAPTDEVSKVKAHAEKLAASKTYKILLPPRTSESIEKVANEWGVDAASVIADIIERWVTERTKRGLPIID